MTDKLEYSAKLTGESLLLFEFKIVAELKKKGLSDKEIRNLIKEDNLFQYKYKSSINRRLTPLIQRVNIIDEYLLDMFINDPYDTGKFINFYAIMKNDRLFFEFMNEVVREKLNSTSEIIEKKDINLFFQQKAEQSEIVSKWSETTVSKLKQVIMKILSEVGIVEDIKTGKVHKLYISEELKNYLIKLGDKSYVIAIGENI